MSAMKAARFLGQQKEELAEKKVVIVTHNPSPEKLRRRLRLCLNVEKNARYI